MVAKRDVQSDDSRGMTMRTEAAPAADHRTHWFRAIFGGAFALTLLIYLFRLDRVVGLLSDDSWYVLLAQALATGQGYTLINSPTPGILPLYPPGFPFLLSLVYRLYPQFPENLWLLKSVSIVSMMLVGVALYRYFRRDRGLSESAALGVSFTTMICPPLVFLASSSVMSDCVFMLWVVLTIVAVERVKGAPIGPRMWGWTLAAGSAASFAYLTRSIAIALIAAAPLYFLQHRLRRAAALFLIVVAVGCGPWMVYTKLHAPTEAQRLEQGGNMVLPYTYQFWQRLAGDPESPQVTARELPARVGRNLLEVAGRDVGRILITVIFEKLRDPYKEAARMDQEGTDEGEILWISLLLSVFVVCGFFLTILERISFAEIALPMMLLLIVLWPFETIRYVLPFAPFLIFYFYQGIAGLQKLLPARQQNFAAAALAAIIILHLYGNFHFIAASYDHTSLTGNPWGRKYEEIEKTIQYLDRVASKNDVAASTNPALITLLTGRKTVGWDNPSLKWDNWKRLSVRHLVWLMVYPRPPQAEEEKFRTIYMSRDGSNFRVVDLGPPESRVSWK
jgi:hypothetical protein